MLIAHHHLPRGAAATEPRRPLEVRIDGLAYPATSRGIVAAGAFRRFGVLGRRSYKGRAS